MLLRGNQNPSRCICIATQFCFLLDNLSRPLCYKENRILFTIFSFPHSCLQLPQCGQQHLLPDLLLLGSGVLQVRKHTRLSLHLYCYSVSLPVYSFHPALFYTVLPLGQQGIKTSKRVIRYSLPTVRTFIKMIKSLFYYNDTDLLIIVNRCSTRRVFGCDNKKRKKSTYVI